MEEIFIGIISAVGGSVLTWMASKSDHDNSVFKEVFDSWKEEREAVGKLRSLMDSLPKVPPHLPEIMEAMSEGYDYPMWIHDFSNNCWFLSRKYCEAFNLSYNGFWFPVNLYEKAPADTLCEFMENDLKLEGPECLREKVEPPLGNGEEWIIVKIPIEVEGKRYILGAASQEPRVLFGYYCD